MTHGISSLKHMFVVSDFRNFNIKTSGTVFSYYFDLKVLEVQEAFEFNSFGSQICT